MVQRPILRVLRVHTLPQCHDWRPNDCPGNLFVRRISQFLLLNSREPIPLSTQRCAQRRLHGRLHREKRCQLHRLCAGQTMDNSLSFILYVRSSKFCCRNEVTFWATIHARGASRSRGSSHDRISILEAGDMLTRSGTVTSNIVSVPPPNTCLTVNKSTNQFYGNGIDVWWFKMWILLKNIVHYYLFTSKSTQATALTARTDPNDCFRLDAEESSLNALNYVYYAASKYPFSRIGDSESQIRGISDRRCLFFYRSLWEVQRLSHISTHRPHFIGD